MSGGQGTEHAKADFGSERENGTGAVKGEGINKTGNSLPQKRRSVDEYTVAEALESDIGNPVTPAVEIEYTVTADLKDVDNPQESFGLMMSLLQSKDWAEVCQGLVIVRRLAVFHSSLISNQLASLMPVILRSIKNPRSALCKTALMTVGDLFTYQQDRMLSHMEELLLQLLLKASQDKRFVCEEAERALLAMTSSLSPIPVLRKLQPYSTHKNPRVRAKAAVSTHHCVSRLGQGGIGEFGLGALMRLAAPMVTDQLPEGRDAGRKTVLDLQAAYLQMNATTPRDDSGSGEDTATEDPWEKLCSSELSPTYALAVIRVTAAGSGTTSAAANGS